MKLDQYLETIDKLGFSLEHFCLCHRISRQSMAKYKNGAIPHISVAKKIEKATKGTVTLRDLGISS